ncbi:MAG: hypothetical protein DCC75_12065 [Proteobacteria bacterium]|nr:MAG: hypothetical protein DCC75_12065 [Pseudomonadota bacterium]
MLIFLIFGEGNKFVPLPKRQMPPPLVSAPSANEAYEDLVVRFNKDIEGLSGAVHETKVALETQIQQSKDYEARTAEIFKRILERMAETEAAVTNANLQNASPVDVGDGRDPSADLDDEDELETIGFDEPVVAPPAPPEKAKIAFVAAGDSVRVKLLAGVNAPTDGTPYPVVFKLNSDVYGPDGSSLPLGEARLIAASQGSLTDSRALFRLSSLNLRFPDGRRRVLPIDGWVVGEDGIRGMEGVLIDPIGKAIGGAMMAGGLDGLGVGLSSGQVSTYSSYYGSQSVLTGDESKYAAGRALSSAAREWGSIIRERANMMVPHVEVLSGREGTAVFSKSFEITDLYEALEEDSNQFASLD